MIAEGKLKLRIAKTYPLADAPQAHIDLEARKVAGQAAADSVGSCAVKSDGALENPDDSG